MPRANQWQKNKEVYAFLITLDISGFSRYMEEPDQLLAHRERFFRAIENTSLFAQAKQSKKVVVHFLGDELRLAFLASLGVRPVYDFLGEVLDALQAQNPVVHAERQTHVKGTALAGVIMWKEWRKCSFLDCDLPFKAQQWTADLHPGDIVADSEFKKAMVADGIPTARLPVGEFAGETGYLLRKGV